MNPLSEPRLLNPRLTPQWSGRPTAQAFWQCVGQCLWAAAHRERSVSRTRAEHEKVVRRDGL